MARIGIIKETEIVFHSGIDLDFQVCDLRTAINIERFEFRECLGREFYKSMLATLAEYPCKKWMPKDEDGNVIVYEEGDVVIYNGVFKIALKDNSDIPSVKSSWANAPKFDLEKLCGNEFEELWCEYLAEYISLAIIKQRLPFIATKISKDGLIKLFGQNFQAASSKDFDTLKGAIDTQISIVFANMDDYMKEEQEDGTTCFDNYKGIALTCCGGCGCEEKKCRCEDSCVDNSLSEGTYISG